ncbi:MAG TPA: hypothetical protein VFV73_21740 [Streptosporangiaceae bacterium]|nr:hypothetical protein [Streptosporangiaceae bacterium]
MVYSKRALAHMSQYGRVLTGTRVAVRAELRGQDGGDVAHPHGGAGADVAASGGAGGFHGQAVRGGDVADVGDGEAEPRDSGQLAGEQQADRLHGGGLLPALERAEHQAGVDGDQFHGMGGGEVQATRSA